MYESIVAATNVTLLCIMHSIYFHLCNATFVYWIPEKDRGHCGMHNAVHMCSICDAVYETFDLHMSGCETSLCLLKLLSFCALHPDRHRLRCRVDTAAATAQGSLVGPGILRCILRCICLCCWVCGRLCRALLLLFPAPCSRQRQRQ